MNVKKYHTSAWRHWLGFPFIWLNLIPIIFADIITEIYHRVCFPLYGLPLIDRKRYIRIDRHRLKYLNWADKISCAYCGYANGWIHYAAAIGARTEAHFCGIKHAKREGAYEQPHHKNFPDYGDEQAYKDMYDIK